MKYELLHKIWFVRHPGAGEAQTKLPSSVRDIAACIHKAIQTDYTNTFQNEPTCLKDKPLKRDFIFKIVWNSQIMKPVQNCTGFIFCTFHILYVAIQTENTNTFHNELTRLKDKLLKMDFIVLFCCQNCMKFTNYETFAKLRRFHILYITCGSAPLYEGTYLKCGRKLMSQHYTKIKKNRLTLMFAIQYHWLQFLVDSVKKLWERNSTVTGFNKQNFWA